MLLRLLRFEPIWLLLLAPAILLPGRFIPHAQHGVAVVALFLFWPLRRAATGRLSIPSPVNWCVAVLLLWMPVAIWAAPDTARAWEVAGYTLFGVAVGAALVNAPAVQHRPQRIVWALLAIGAGLAALGPLVMTTVTPADAWLWRIQSAFHPLSALVGETINPNILAGGLLVAFAFAAALAAARGPLASRPARTAWLRAGCALLALVLIAVVWLAGSRATLLAMATVLLLLAVVRRPRLAWALPLLALAIGVLLTLRWDAVAAMFGAGEANGLIGLEERLEIWARALRLIYDFPLTGAGLGAFTQVIPVLYPYFLIPASVHVPDAHHLALQVGVDLGLPGLVAFTALLLCLVAMLGCVLHRRSGLEHALAAGASGVLAGTLAAGLFGAVNWGVKLSFLFWLVVALTVLLYWRVEPSDAEDAGSSQR